MKILLIYKKDGDEKAASISSMKNLKKVFKNLNHEVKTLSISESVKIDDLEGYDFIFNVAYGRFGEDGFITPLLKKLNIPSNTPSLFTSKVTYNKLETKKVLLANRINYPRLTKKIPFVLKRAEGGSSENIYLVENSRGYEKLKNKILSNEFICEEFLDGREFCVILFKLKNKFSFLPIAEIKKDGNLFHSKIKFNKRDRSVIVPALINDVVRKDLIGLAEKAFNAVEAQNIIKVDIGFDLLGIPKVIEVDSIPGFCDRCMLSLMIKSGGLTFEKVINSILQESFSNY